MSNELLFVAVAVGLAVVAIRLARFMILDDPLTAVLHRVSVQRADDTEVGR